MARHEFFAFLLLLLLLLPSLASSQAQTGNISGVTSSQYTDQSLSLLSNQDMITLSTLNAWTQGQLSVGSYENAIQQNLLPLNIRTILLDIGWQNYPIGAIPYQVWLNNWLTASDVLGVSNVFYVGQLTQSGINSTWVNSLLKIDPAVRTYYSSGQPANYVSPDNHDVALALEKDLSLLYSYYGNHTSWVGLGTGYSNNSPYFSSNSTMPVLGYSNYSISNFVNSNFYMRDINSSGYDPNGSLDALWSSFRAMNQSIVLSSGNWWTSSPVHVYARAPYENLATMKFYLPKNTTGGINVQWYGEKMGNPGALSVLIYSGVSGHLSGPPVSNQTVDESSFTGSTGWQKPISFSGNFSAGYYWILFSCLGNSQNYYNIYVGDYQIGNTLAGQMPRLTSSLPTSISSVLWVTNSSGATLSLYPYYNDVVSVPTTQTFVASSTFSFNTVFLFLSDRHLNPTNGTLEVLDASRNNKLIASGILSQSLSHGIQEWTPVILDNTVTTVKGDSYDLVLTEPNGGYSWRVVLRGLETNPVSAGFQNQSQYWLFKLGLSNWGQSYLDFTSMQNTGPDSVTNRTMAALGFKPSANETLESLRLLFNNPAANGTNYTAGNLEVSVETSNFSSIGCAYGPPCSYGVPSGKPLQTVSIPGNEIPTNSWLNITGFNLSVNSSTQYWIVFTTNSSQSYPFARLVSPFNLPVIVSFNRGLSWTFSGEGPTEYSCVITLTHEQIGNAIDNIHGIGLGSSTYFAQPFIASSSGQIDGVSIGPISRGSTSPSDLLQVSINPDDGQNAPSSLSIASGVISGNNITLPYSLQFVQFLSVARLHAGEKYWIVVRPIIGRFSIFPAFYSESPFPKSQNITALQTQNSGFDWRKINNDTVYASYFFASPPGSPLQDLNTSQIYQSLSQNHDFSDSLQPPRGWSAYIQYSELSTYHQITSWLSNYSLRSFTFYTSNDVGAAANLAYSDLLASPPINSNSCAELTNYFLAHIPTQGQQYHPTTGRSLLSGCNSPDISELAVQLGLMKYEGTNYGSSQRLSVLITGDTEASNLTNSLKSAYNVSYTSIDSTTNLTQKIGAGNYSSIIWTAQNSSSDSLHALEVYLANGGQLIIAETLPSWMSNLTNFVSNTSSSSTADSSALSAIAAATANTNLSSSISLERATNNSFVAGGGNITLAEGHYEAGTIVILESKPAIVNAPQVSTYTVILSNIVSSTAGNVSPFWYGRGTTQTPLTYGIMGEKGGPVLVWLSNPSNNSLPVSLELNASFYGLTDSWQLLYPVQLEESAGNSSVVSINATIAPESWTPIYVIPYSPQLALQYTNLNLVYQEVFPGQSYYLLAGSSNQSAIVILWSKSPISNVTLGNDSNLTKLNSTSSLHSSKEGWYYDTQSNTLFLKYPSSGTDSIRVYQAQTSNQASRSLFQTELEYALAGVISVEIAFLVYIGVSRKMRK